MAKIGYKELFWLDDACCEQNPTHFSALVAFNMPVKKHYGEGKAVDVIREYVYFISIHTGVQ